MQSRSCAGGDARPELKSQSYSKSLEIISQVDFLLTYGAVRGFYALSVVGFKVIVRREWGRRTVDFSLKTNMIYEFIFKDCEIFYTYHRCIRQKFQLVYSCDVSAHIYSPIKPLV